MKDIEDIRRWHKVLLLMLKVIPILLATASLLNTILSYFDIEMAVFSYICTALLVSFLYIASYEFQFCNYHRMFLHYFVVNIVLNTYDYYIGIPLSDKNLLMMYLVITGIFMFFTLYLYLRRKKRAL